MQFIQHHESSEVVLEIEVETKHSKGYDLYAEIDDEKVLLKNGKGKIKIENPNTAYLMN